MSLTEIYYNTMGKAYLKIKVYAQNTLVKTHVVRDKGQDSITIEKKKFIITNNEEDFKREKFGKVFCYDASSCMPLNAGENEAVPLIKLRLETISPEELQSVMEKQTVIDLMSIGITDMSWVKWVAYAAIIIACGYFAYNLFG